MTFRLALNAQPRPCCPAQPSVLEGLLDLFYTEEAGFEGTKYLLT